MFKNAVTRNLVDAAFDGIVYDELVDMCAKALDNPLVVIDNAFNIIAYSKSLKANDTIWQEAVARGYITLEFGSTLSNWDKVAEPNKPYIDVDKISNKVRRFIKMDFEGHTYGYLNITEDKSPLDRLAIEDYLFIARLLTKELLFNLKDLDIKDITVNEEEIILDLLKEHFIDRVHFISRCHSLELINKVPYKIACIDLDSFISYNAKTSDITTTIRSYIPASTLVFYDKSLVIFTSGDIKDPKAIDDFLKENDLMMGISDTSNDIYSLKEYYKEAKAAIRLHHLSSDETRICHYDKIRHYHMYEHFDNDELLLFCDQKILTLKHLDDHHNTDYIKTLKYYLIYQKSIQQTAQAMYLHRNTINYRILKIKEILGIEDEDIDPTLLWSIEMIRFINERNRHHL